VVALRHRRPVGDNRARVTSAELNRRELERYLERVTDRWPVQRALLGGARVDDLNGAPAQRERGSEYVLVLVSEHFDGVPWLERVYQAGSLWDALEMGAAADVHCYTPQEFERKLEQLRVVRETADHGLELLPEPA
jgi:uncharacterized protein